MQIIVKNTGRIRFTLAGLILGALIALAVVYYTDGPLYTPSEIDGILAEKLNPQGN